MTIDFNELGNIESFYGNMMEPEGYGVFDQDDISCEEDVIIRCADCKKPIDDCIC